MKYNKLGNWARKSNRGREKEERREVLTVSLLKERKTGLNTLFQITHVFLSGKPIL